MDNLMLNIIDDFLSIDFESEESVTWKIEDDVAADWVLDKIKLEDEELEAYKKVIDTKIDQLKKVLDKKQKERDRSVLFFQGKLIEYFEKQKKKETKTTLKYELPGAVLKKGKDATKIDYDKDKLLEIAKKNDDLKEYVKVKEDFAWGELKKKLKITNNKVINIETGEIVDFEGISLKNVPGEFKIEWRK